MSKLIKIINFLYEFLLVRISTIIMRIICRANDIKIDDKSRFWGLTKVSKEGNGAILIGENCRFRSKSTSNLIGINRPCILSIHGNEKPNLVIGDNCGLSGTVIGCFTKILIGKNVRCGANTLITDSDWHLDDYRAGKPRPVVIEDNVWLGANVVVLKGVTIGENSLIGSNSVVVKNIPPNVIAAGNPCRVIKNIEPK